MTNTISSGMFRWDKNLNAFSQYDSSLPNDVEKFVATPYDGHTGFFMKSEKTGVCVRFVLYKTDSDAEGEIAGWHFKPSAADINSNPRLRDVTCLIIND